MHHWKVNCNTLYLGHVVVTHCSPSISCTPHCHWHKDDDECLGLPEEYEPVECCCLRAERLYVSAAGAHSHLTESLCPWWNVSLAANVPGKSSFSSEAHCTYVSVSQLRTIFVLVFFPVFLWGCLVMQLVCYLRCQSSRILLQKVVELLLMMQLLWWTKHGT